MQRYSEHSPTVDLSDSFALAGRQDAKRTILLLEDDVPFRDIMRDFLGNHGFEVVAVLNGVDGGHAVLAVGRADGRTPAPPDPARPGGRTRERGGTGR